MKIKQPQLNSKFFQQAVKFSATFDFQIVITFTLF